MKKTLVKILCSLIMVCSFYMQANAAPTVKKLGTSSVATKSATVKSDSAAVMPNRAASVRFDTSKTVSSAPKKVTSTETDTTARLPASKYLQVVHSVKPENISGSGGVTPTPASGDVIVIKDQLDAVENDVNTLRQDLSDHVNNTDVHVTATEKDVWNDKQERLTPGEGIEIENSVISATMKLPVGSQDAPHTAPIWVE